MCATKTVTKECDISKIEGFWDSTKPSLNDIMSNQKLAKKSNVRLVISGNNVEFFSYENAFFWNLEPQRTENGCWGLSNSKRADNSVRAKTNLIRLIWANENEWNERVKFVTYTFAENMTDVATANLCWTEHVRKLRARFGVLRYVCVPEFQTRGAVHYHVLFFNMPFVRGLKDVLAREWGHGFIKVKAINKIRDVGLYVGKYITKQRDDTRLVTLKAYFGSRGLKTPTTIKNEKQVDIWMWKNQNRVVLSESEYRSNYYGTVKKITYACRNNTKGNSFESRR